MSDLCYLGKTRVKQPPCPKRSNRKEEVPLFASHNCVSCYSAVRVLYPGRDGRGAGPVTAAPRDVLKCCVLYYSAVFYTTVLCFILQCCVLCYSAVFYVTVLCFILQCCVLYYSAVFYITVLFVCCILGGMVAELVRLPPLLGMLITGCLLRNVPVVNVAKDIDTNWSGALR